MQLQNILDALEQIAPTALQENFDNCGLLVGQRQADITGILLCIDVSEQVIDEAKQHGCNLIISHHPLIFRGLKTITGSNEVERCVISAIKNDIAIYASHTCMDSVWGGVSFKMGEKLGLQNLQILVPQQQQLLKLVTFVPTTHLEQVRSALFAAGAGHIGHYDACSYAGEGQGTFRAETGTHPFCGTVGEFHTEPETRLEVILPKFRQATVVSALLRAHPYEEPAFDLIALENAWPMAGLGVVGNLPESMDETTFLQCLKRTFACEAVRHSPFLGRPVQRIALCGGSGADFITAAKAAHADVYVTADVTYHRFFEADNRLVIADIGHFESEQFTKEIFLEQLSKKIPNFAIRLAESEPKRVLVH
ncbi:MAG: Nif3-like dinuclear metal center hexameric protein [Paludibacteraceae bacterium]